MALTQARLVLLAVCALPAWAGAFQDRMMGAYLEGGGTPFRDGDASTYSQGIGLLLPWSPMNRFVEGPQSLYWDLFLGNWSTRAQDGGRSSFAQAGAVLTWRYRFLDASSSWFAELGLGGSLMDRLYQTPERQFTTTFQFTELLGVGLSLGDDGRQELGLRLQHFSNAGIRKPNPGETFVRVRYTYRF